MPRNVPVIVTSLLIALNLSGTLAARSWTSIGGRYSVEGEVVRVERDRVVLETPLGKRFSVLLEKLSPVDRAFAIRNYGPEAQEAGKKLPGLFSELEQALNDRDYKAAQRLRNEVVGIAVSDDQRESAEQAATFARDAEHCFRAFQLSVRELNVGQVLTLHQHDSSLPAGRAQIVGGEQTTIHLEVDGKRYAFDLNDPAALPSNLVAGLARSALPRSSEGLRKLDAFLRVDGRQQDKQRWIAATIAPNAPPVATVRPKPAERPKAPSLKDFPDELEKMRQLFPKEYAAARDPAQRLKLAERLFTYAQEMTRDDPAGHFVLMWEAASLSARSGRVDTAVGIVESLEQRFQIDELIQRKTSLMEQACRVPKRDEDHLRLMKYCLGVADEAVRQDQYTAAFELIDSAGAAVNMLNDRTLKLRFKGELLERKTQIRRVRTEFGEVTAALEQLAQTPDDAAANLRVGRFYCLVKGNWTEGLEYLAKSEHPQLRKLALLDRNVPSQPANQLELANQWWDLAEDREFETNRDALRSRAVHWYRKVQPVLKGREKLAVDVRLEQVRKTEPELRLERVRLSSLTPVRVQGVELQAGQDLVRRQSVVKQQPREFAIWAQPSQTDGITQIRYRLDKKYLTFRGSVGFDDSHRPGQRQTAILFEPAAAPGQPARGVVVPADTVWRPIAFQILNSKGQKLWASKVLNPGETQSFEVAVGNVEELVLMTVCQGTHTLAPAVWVEPLLILK